MEKAQEKVTREVRNGIVTKIFNIIIYYFTSSLLHGLVHFWGGLLHTDQHYV